MNDDLLKAIATSAIVDIRKLVDRVNLAPDSPNVDEAIRHLVIARAILLSLTDKLI